MIRALVAKQKNYVVLEKRRDESAYLYTLTFSPAWKKKFAGQLLKMRKVAKSEYTKTAKAINKRLKSLGIKKKVDTVLN